MAEILSDVGTVATTLFSVATSAMTWVMDNPLALIGAISMIVVTGIGVAKNLVRGL